MNNGLFARLRQGLASLVQKWQKKKSAPSPEAELGPEQLPPSDPNVTLTGEDRTADIDIASFPEEISLAENNSEAEIPSEIPSEISLSEQHQEEPIESELSHSDIVPESEVPTELTPQTFNQVSEQKLTEETLSRIELSKLSEESISKQETEFETTEKRPIWANLIAFLRSLPQKLPTKGPISAGPLQNFDFSQLSDKLFSPKSRPRIQQAFVLSTVILCTYIASKSLALFLRGIEEVPKERISPLKLENTIALSDFDAIRSTNIFNSAERTGGTQKKKVDENIICEEGEMPTSLPLRLMNTVVLQDSVKSVAAIQMNGAQELKELRIGEKLEGNSRIDRIERLRVVLKNLETGSCEILENSEFKQAGRPMAVLNPSEGKKLMKSQRPQGIKNDGNRFSISKKLISEKLKDLPNLLTQAKGIKMTNPDGSLSFKITEVDPGGLFAHLGIQNDDSITAINGKKITSMNEVMDLFGKIQDLSQLNLSVSREGEEMSLDYQFGN